MRFLRFIVAAMVLSILHSPWVHAADSAASAPESIELTQKSIDRVTIQNLTELPQFILAPSATYHKRFASSANLSEAIVFAACMIFLGVSTAYLLAVAGKIELSSLVFVYVGTVVLWIFYAGLMHGIARLMGAQRGIEFTISAYLYVIGSLQPLLAILLAGLSRMCQKTVDFREIKSFGFSSAGTLLAHGKFFSTDVTVVYRLVSGTLIMIYFAIALVPAQQLSVLQAVSVAIGALLIFVFVGVVLYFASRLIGITTLARLLGE